MNVNITLEQLEATFKIWGSKADWFANMFWTAVSQGKINLI